MAPPRRIVLIGMPGSGKSTIARLVARRLGWMPGDTDDQIVSVDGRSIPRIFAEDGEPYFRALERQCVLQLSKGDRWVVATGGGAVLDPVNRERLWRESFVVHLAATVAGLLPRVARENSRAAGRPLLEGDDPAVRLEALLRERAPLYALADWSVPIDGRSPDEIAALIVAAWERESETLCARPGRMERVAGEPVAARTDADRSAEEPSASMIIESSDTGSREREAEQPGADARPPQPVSGDDRPAVAGARPEENGVMVQQTSAQQPAPEDEASLTLPLVDAVAAAVMETPAEALPDPADPTPAAWVETPGGRYPVYAGWGILPRLPQWLRERGLTSAVHVIADENVARLHGPALLQALQEGGAEPVMHTLPLSESRKTLAAAEELFDRLVERRAERSHALLAFGGGVATDLGGFVAATYLRGLPLVQLPTSLLGMVDAAIGGKTAVNHREGKNLIGAFYQPALVVCDAALLGSLPEREYRSGWAEVIKHALIMDPELLVWLEADAERLLALEPAPLVRALRRSIALKARVVGADEREAGLRMTLNYGHTTGHALEAVTGYETLLHGEAVAVGMVAAAAIGRELGLLSEDDEARQNALIARFGLPLSAPGIDPDAVLAAMSLDKKVSAKALRWVLLDGIGRTTIRADVPLSLVREAVARVVAEPIEEP